VARRDPHQFYETFVSVFRRVRSVAEQGYAPLELGSAQAKLLRHIGQDSRISQADLARATGTAPTLTGRALEPLVQRGWVRRKRSEEDRRQYVLELTAAGQRARERVLKVRGGIIERLVGALDERDMADFERIAGKILAVFDDEAQPSEPRTRAR
jgi:DNA-binding MarR family transcriptional regulator